MGLRVVLLMCSTGCPANAVPSTFVVDKDHKVAAVFLVPVLASDVQPVLDELAKE